MAKCIDCKFCVKMKSDIDKRKLFVCDIQVAKLCMMGNPEKWILFETGVLEKMCEINPLKEQECYKFKAIRR